MNSSTYAYYTIGKDDDVHVQTSDTETLETLFPWTVFDNLESTPPPSLQITSLAVRFRRCVLEVCFVDGAENDKVVTKIVKDVDLFSRILL